MKYKFVDIGCGHRCVSTDKFGLNSKGLLVEPIKEYCNILPNSPTVKIECSAIGEYNGVKEIFSNTNPNPIYIPSSLWEDKIKRERIKKSVTIHGTSSFKVDIQNNIYNPQKRKVNIITLESLFLKYNVTEIDYLKIDTEGYEDIILTQLLKLLRDCKIKINKRITFEYHNSGNIFGKNFLNTLDKIRDNIANEFNFSWEYIEDDWDKDIIMDKQEKQNKYYDTL